MIEIEVLDTDWRPTGAEGDPRGRLLASMTIAGTHHHMEAFEVKKGEDGILTFAEGAHLSDEDMNSLVETFGPDGPFETTEIEGRQYMIFVHPYS